MPLVGGPRPRIVARRRAPKQTLCLVASATYTKMDCDGDSFCNACGFSGRRANGRGLHALAAPLGSPPALSTAAANAHSTWRRPAIAAASGSSSQAGAKWQRRGRGEACRQHNHRAHSGRPMNRPARVNRWRWRRWSRRCWGATRATAAGWGATVGGACAADSGQPRSICGPRRRHLRL